MQRRDPDRPRELTLDSLDERVDVLERRAEGFDAMTAVTWKAIGACVAISTIGSFVMLLVGGHTL